MKPQAQVAFRSVQHYNSRLHAKERLPSSPYEIAKVLLRRLFDAELKAGRKLEYANFFVCTTCPDRLSPSLGQSLQAEFNEILGSTPTHDLIQGCAGSVTNLVLASQLVQASRKPILFVAVEAASRAVSTRNEMHEFFSDGGFVCVVEPSQNPSQGLLKHCTIQYPDVRDTVLVGLGHHTRELIQSQENSKDFRKALEVIEDGVSLEFNKKNALKLAAKAPKYIEEFFSDTTEPEIVILHQVNPRILADVRRQAFAKYDERFFDWTKEVGNCGVASPGVVLAANWDQVQGKRVFLCSFGTGGVISGSYWQL